MHKMYEETISGLNKFIEEQQNTANETNIPTNITLKTFDDITLLFLDLIIVLLKMFRT